MRVFLPALLVLLSLSPRPLGARQAGHAGDPNDQVNAAPEPNVSESSSIQVEKWATPESGWLYVLIERHKTHAVKVGKVTVGGGAPIVIQSMTNTDTADAEGTAQQCIELAMAGSELVRITLNVPEAAVRPCRRSSNACLTLAAKRR